LGSDSRNRAGELRDNRLTKTEYVGCYRPTVLRNAYGLRLLVTPAGRRVGAGLIVVVIVAFRLVQGVLTWPAYGGYDFKYYWVAGRQILDGLPIYSATQLAGPYAPQGQDGFLYAPPFAVVGVPFALLSRDDYHAAAILWTVVGAMLATAAMLALVRSERLAERFPILAGRGRWLVPLAAFAFPPFLGELLVGNVHLILLALYAFAWIQIRRATAGGDRFAGIAIGVAAVIKIFPGVLLLWFLLVGRRRAFVYAIVGALGVAAITVPFTGLQAWFDYPTVLLNQAAPIDTTDALAPTVFLTPVLGFGVARIVVTIAGLAIVAWASLQRELAVSFATAVLMSVLIAPAMWHHYLAILVLPMLLGLGAGISPVWMAGTYLLLSGSQPVVSGDLTWIVKRGFPITGAATLLLGLLWRVRRSPVAGSADRASEPVATAPTPV
jgi:alpha-1,2-mannosyltransferase